MSYTHEDFQKVGRCGRTVMYSTFKLCGIAPNKEGGYTEEDMERFKLARKMKKERKSDEDIAEYFKVNLRSAVEDEDEEVADYTAAGAEQAGDAVDVHLAETMVGMYRGSAKKLSDIAPAVAVHCLVEELNSEATRQKFANLRSQLENGGGSSAAFLLRMVHSQQLAPSKQSSTSLPPAFGESLKQEQPNDDNS